MIKYKLKKYISRWSEPKGNIFQWWTYYSPPLMNLQFFGTSRVTPWRDPDTLFFWRCWYLWWPTVVSFVYVEDGSLWPSMYPLIYLTYIIIPLMPTMQWQSRNNHLFSGALVLSHRSSYLFFERKMTPWNMWMNLHYCLLFETWTQCCQLW